MWIDWLTDIAIFDKYDLRLYTYICKKKNAISVLANMAVSCQLFTFWRYTCRMFIYFCNCLLFFFYLKKKCYILLLRGIYLLPWFCYYLCAKICYILIIRCIYIYFPHFVTMYMWSYILIIRCIDLLPGYCYYLYAKLCLLIICFFKNIFKSICFWCTCTCPVIFFSFCYSLFSISLLIFHWSDSVYIERFQ